MTFYEILVLAEVAVCIWATVVCFKKVVQAPAMLLAGLGMLMLAIAPIAVFVWEICGRWWGWAPPDFFADNTVLVNRLWAGIQLAALVLITLGIKFSYRQEKK